MQQRIGGKRATVLNPRGFTLVEAIVAGVIVAIIGGIMVTYLNLFYGQVNQGTLRAKMQMDYDIASQQIGSIVRASKLVLGPGETMSQSFPVLDTVTEIHLWTASGKDTADYRISGNVLQEYVGGAWIDFKAGSRKVTVTPGSGFTIAGGRRSVVLNVNIQESYMGKIDSLLIKGDNYLCRN